MYILEYLEKKYGRDAVENDGFKVITTLDWSLERKAEDIVAEYGMENENRFNAGNAGLITIDPKTGQILVMVGSRDFFNNEREGNFNITLAHRQPGSAFKPFVYATAFNKGYAPETVVFDLPTEFSTACSPAGLPLYNNDPNECYMPTNYDEKYRGPINLRSALAQSINIPAVKVLYLAGINESIETARNLGISSLENSGRYGLTLVLGGGEVTLLEMTGAYGVFANDGIRNDITGIISVSDVNGNILEEFIPAPKRVLEANTARLISDILSDNEARTPTFGASSPLYFPGISVAAKTGTTNDYKDAWVLGYTPSLAVGAWVGNNDNTSMEKKVAGFIVAPLWHAFFEEALRGKVDEPFIPPETTLSDIKPILRGLWQDGGIHSILYWINKDDPMGPAPINPFKDPQFTLWETPVQNYLPNIQR